MSGNNVIKFTNYEAMSKPGEYYRLLCLTGENKGDIYYLNGKRIILGRGKEADIFVKDLKSSREHAEIMQVRDGWIITDLGSHNGLVLNDRKITQENLIEGDRIVIGQTVYKFDFQKIAEGVKAPAVRPKIEVVDEVDEDDDDYEEDEEEKLDPEKEKKNNKKVIIYAVVIGFLALSLMEEPAQKGSGAGANQSRAQDITDEFATLSQDRNLGSTKEEKELRKKLDSVFKKGTREMREGNYYRALSEFNLALILSPNNRTAHFFIKKTEEALKNDVESYFIKAERDYQSLKYENAIKSYCTIVRILQFFPKDERREDAIANIKKIAELIDKDESQIECLKE